MRDLEWRACEPGYLSDHQRHNTRVMAERDVASDPSCQKVTAQGGTFLAQSPSKQG